MCALEEVGRTFNFLCEFPPFIVFISTRKAVAAHCVLSVQYLLERLVKSLGRLTKPTYGRVFGAINMLGSVGSLAKPNACS